MPNTEVPTTTEHTQSLVISGPQNLRQPFETLDVSAEEVQPLLDYWNAISKRRWLVLSCLLIVFSTVAIGTLKKKPIYEGKAVIEINPEQPNVLDFKEVVKLMRSISMPTAGPSTRFCRAEAWPSMSSIV